MFEIRCKSCDFLCGYGDETASLTCIYCRSERQFTTDNINRRTNYIYETIPDDKSHYRRGLMHDRKNAIRLLFEDDEE